VRVDNAFPAIVSGQEFGRVQRLLGEKAPRAAHPRRVASPYLLSGLAKCATCGSAMTAAESKGGRYAYYVCQTLLKQGGGACSTPRLNAPRFEQLIIGQLRDHILTESNIRGLVRLVDEEMDRAAREERQRLETIETELDEVKRRLTRTWRIVETTDVVAAYAAEMSEFLRSSELTETKAFIRSFVKEVSVKPGSAAIVYTIPTPEDSPSPAQTSPRSPWARPFAER